MRGSHTLVLGGGIVGLSSAYYLARRGERVTLLDRDAPGQGASGGNAGILAAGHPPLPRPGLIGDMLRILFRSTNPVYIAPRPDPSLPVWILQFLRACTPRSFDRSMHLLAGMGKAAAECAREIIEGEAIDCEYHRTGWLEVFRTRDALAKARGPAETLRRFGYAVDELDGKRLREREPAFDEHVIGALHFVDSAFAHPAKLVRGLAARVEALGVDVRFETEVERLTTSGGKFRGARLTDGSTIEADRLVLAAGSWSTRLARSIGVRVPLQPGKGYHLDLRGLELRPSTTCVLAEVFVAVTPLDGGLRLAGTVELSGLNLRLVRRRLDMLPRGARIYLRGIEQARVESEWCGLRPMTGDGLPVLGWAPGVEGVFVATGHAMMGFLLGPLSGRLASEALLDGRTSLDISALTPARFCRRGNLPAAGRVSPGAGG